MKKNTELYDALERVLAGHKYTSDQIVKLVRNEVSCEFKDGSLKTILYRQAAKGVFRHEGDLFWINEEQPQEEKEIVSKEKNEMEEYLNMLLSITSSKEKELEKNPFEQYENENSWMQARKMYSFNKKIQNMIKKELNSIKL